MWHFSRKNIDKMTKTKIGRQGDERCEANCLGCRVMSLCDEHREIALASYVCQYGLEDKLPRRRRTTIVIT